MGKKLMNSESVSHPWKEWGTPAGPLKGPYVAVPSKALCMEEKETLCMKCKVYKRYHRGMGARVDIVKKKYPDEEKRYQQLLLDRIAKHLGCQV